ncbi:hypothetical protein [Mycetohabitans endofungorum]|uniref:hypothetical protein n=1 Tax=Mycetohabitans endofungorum TaxID=417203 RepID=UPI002B060F3C|nr:hypothetical protein [Mycetohabitans endofungorum]
MHRKQDQLGARGAYLARAVIQSCMELVRQFSCCQVRAWIVGFDKMVQQLRARPEARFVNT